MIKNNKMILSALLVSLIFPFVTQAMTWAVLSTKVMLFSVPMIVLSLVIEPFFFKWLFGLKIKKAILYALVANIVSNVIGPFARLLSVYIFDAVFFYFFRINSSFFNFSFVTGWFIIPTIIAGAVNSLLELLIIRIIWKHKITKRNFMVIWVINFAIMVVAIIWTFHYTHYGWGVWRINW